MWRGAPRRQVGKHLEGIEARNPPGRHVDRGKEPRGAAPVQGVGPRGHTPEEGFIRRPRTWHASSQAVACRAGGRTARSVSLRFGANPLSVILRISPGLNSRIGGPQKPVPARHDGASSANLIASDDAGIQELDEVDNGQIWPAWVWPRASGWRRAGQRAPLPMGCGTSRSSRRPAGCSAPDRRNTDMPSCLRAVRSSTPARTSPGATCTEVSRNTRMPRARRAPGTVEARVVLMVAGDPPDAEPCLQLQQHRRKRLAESDVVIDNVASHGDEVGLEGLNLCDALFEPASAKLRAEWRSEIWTITRPSCSGLRPGTRTSCSLMTGARAP